MALLSRSGLRGVMLLRALLGLLTIAMRRCGVSTWMRSLMDGLGRLMGVLWLLGVVGWLAMRMVMRS